MGGTWRLMGQYDAETTTYSAFAATGMTSPYTPDFNGTLKALRVVVNRSAVTSLINHVGIRLTCTTFTPNSIEVGGQGSGIQTAPAAFQDAMDWIVNQKVQAGVPITLEGRNITADTPVTVSVLVYGYFEA